MNLYFDDIEKQKEYSVEDFENDIIYNPKLVKRIEEKIDMAENTFNNIWHIDEHLLKKQFYKFKKECEKFYDVVNFVEIDRYHHLRLYMDSYYGDLFSKKRTLAHVYLIYYHASLEPFIPNSEEKYVLPYIIDDQYVLFILFDENEIHKVYTVISDNMYDLSGTLLLGIIHLKGKVFTKINEKNKIS